MIIATSKPKSFKIGAELIKFYQGGTEFSHILIIKNDLVFQASNGYVNCSHIENFLDDNVIVNIYSIPDEAVDMPFIKKQLGKKYGKDQVFKIALKFITGIRLRSNGNQRFICSELVGKALKLDWVDDYTSPKELIEYIRKTYG